jgi:FkbM family methyltransferase
MREIKATVTGVYSMRSYSQEGEDMILARLFERRPAGFYVDVGAHHPRRFSNTYFFYKRGWHGINIEPNPEAQTLFQQYRKRDINITCGISDNEGELAYFMFNEPALNTFDRTLSEQRVSSKYRIVDTRAVPVRPLSAVLVRSLPPGTHIDFMSVDVEGLDLNVLRSNDWTRFRPTYVLSEVEGFDLVNAPSAPLDRYLTEQGYRLFAKTFNTLFYRDERSPTAGAD